MQMAGLTEIYTAKAMLDSHMALGVKLGELMLSICLIL